MLSEVHLGENAFREGTSGEDCNGHIPKLLQADQAGVLYDVKNDGCPESMIVPDFSGGHIMEESCGVQLSSRLEDLSVSQKHSDLTCMGDHDLMKNVDEQDLSEADCRHHLPAINHHFAEKLSGSGNLLDLAYMNNDDLSYNVIRKQHSGAGLCDHFTPIENLSAPEQFPAHLRYQNDYLSQHLDTHDCFVVDSGNRSSVMDLTSAAQMLSVSTELSEPSSSGNYDLSDSMIGQHYSRSGSPLVTLGAISIENHSEQDQNGRTDPIDFDSDQTTLPDVISPSQRRWSFRKTKSRQDAETVKSKRNGWRAGKVSFDLDMLQIMRRRRSCSGKRAHASSWGLHSNLELDERPSTSRGQSSGKLVKSHPKNHTEKVRRKRSHRTGDISVKLLKSKIGVGVDSNSTMDVSNEGPFEILVKTPGLSEVEEPTKSILSLGFQENLKRTVHVSDDTTYNVGKNFVENISNVGSDLGTSPDSEVINLNPDTGLWGNTEEEFHNIPGSSNVCLASDGATCVVPKNSEIPQKQIFMGGCIAGDKPMESGIVDNDRQSTERVEIAVDVPYIINASASSSSEFLAEKTSSTEQKSEEQSSSTVVDIGSPCGPSADIDTEVTPRAGFDLQSPVVEVSAKEYSHSKGQKILKVKKKDKVRTSRSEVLVSANKAQRKSKKKVNQDKLASKHKITVNLRGGQTSEAERQAGTGNSKLAGLGESGTAKSSLAGDVSTLNVGLTETSEKPRNAWVLCDDCQKWRRISAILADQIDEANRSWICKDNMDKNFGNCSIPQEKSDAEINTELGISDASCDEGVGDARPNSKNLVETQSRVTQQSTWKLIKSNQFLHRKKQTQTIDEIMVCHCKPPSDRGMGCGDGCLNRMLNIECIQGTCPCGELCSNQQFQNRNYAKLEMFKCGKKGYGIQALENISEGQFLIEYVGEVLDMHSYEARQRDYAMQGHKHFYFMTLNGSEVIDACAKGNLGRFINHSCDPNCRTEKWMVNGEVCVGLFALKNIKKGEELTFDYNYVRVFGAAAKKCVCGSSQCRGYIGGNPENTEVVEDDSEDDYPEPVMVCQNGAVDESYPDMTSPLSTFDGIGIMNEEESEKAVDVSRPLDFATSLQAVQTGTEKVNTELTSVVDHEDAIEERLDPSNRAEKTEDLFETLDRAEAVLKQDDTSGETLVTGKPEYVESGEKMKHSRCLTLEDNSASVKLNQMPPYVIDNKRKPKSGLGKGSIKFPVPKASRLASSIKNGKSKSTPVNVHKVKEVQGKNDVPFCKPKKEVEVSTTGRFEAVQEKLNELLNPDGGISKRKDASKGYLKLLLLTAASGDSCNGEAIQSNRYLSMILGALLETKSRTVLVDIINKNGLQMLHNMLKRSRKEFNKIPILRKLLKVFEYLATREILTPEHISDGPTCPGVESFRESILSLTEHIDKQVHQIARNFRDRWIPRPARRHQGEECKKVFPSSSEYCRNSTHNQLSNQTEKCLETPDYVTKSVVKPTTYDAGIGEGSHHSSGSGRNTRKRKSRWDQPGDLNRVDNHTADDATNGIDDDLPPGFAAPCNTTVVSSEVYLPPGFAAPCNTTVVSSEVCSRQTTTTNLDHICEVVSGQPQLRFRSWLPVSYGVPLGLVKQVDMQAATFEGLSVVPGMPFHPFPPLPPYPNNTQNSAPSTVDSAVIGQPAHVQNRSIAQNSSPNSLISRGASMSALEMPGTDNKLDFRQSRGPNTSGRKYFSPQKWNSSKLKPPWIRNRNNWGFTGNNSRNGMNGAGFEIPGDEFRDWHGRERDMYHQPH